MCKSCHGPHHGPGSVWLGMTALKWQEREVLMEEEQTHMKNHSLGLYIYIYIFCWLKGAAHFRVLLYHCKPMSPDCCYWHLSCTTIKVWDAVINLLNHRDPPPPSQWGRSMTLYWSSWPSIWHPDGSPSLVTNCRTSYSPTPATNEMTIPRQSHRCITKLLEKQLTLFLNLLLGWYSDCLQLWMMIKWTVML